MNSHGNEEILRMAEEQEVEIIRLQFTDIFGRMKSVEVTRGQLPGILEHGCLIDGSCLEGFVRMDESDMYLRPDLSTFQVIPWESQMGAAAGVICDVYQANGEIFPGDPRSVFKKVLKQAENMGFRFQAGPECEFFLFHTDEEARPTTITHESASYFDAGPMDLAGGVRRDIVLGLEEMGFCVEASHHELAPGQHEIDLAYREGIRMADDLMTFRLAVKSIAKRRGLHATFMPKPRAGVNGSGLHIHMSMTDLDGNNVFQDSADPLGVSQTAYYFIGGILRHMKAMTLLTNPIVNSYKRLVPGYDAPVQIAWSGTSNRNVILRIPCREGAHTRMELRCPDFAANPYLAQAACLAAGLEGIREKVLPPDPVEARAPLSGRTEEPDIQVPLLPRTMGEAIQAFEGDPFIKELLGDMIYQKYLTAKKAEWEHFCTAVTEWEIHQFLHQY